MLAFGLSLMGGGVMPHEQTAPAAFFPAAKITFAPQPPQNFIISTKSQASHITDMIARYDFEPDIDTASGQQYFRLVSSAGPYVYSIIGYSGMYITAGSAGIIRGETTIAWKNQGRISIRHSKTQVAITTSQKTIRTDFTREPNNTTEATSFRLQMTGSIPSAPLTFFGAYVKEPLNERTKIVPMCTPGSARTGMISFALFYTDRNTLIEY